MQQLSFDGWNAPEVEQQTPENDFNYLLQVVLEEAKQVGVPVSSTISSHVVVNKRAKTRFGSCKKLGSIYIIELSHLLLHAPAFSCKQVLAHEVLHTCNGCRNHGARWRSYAYRMGNAYGYDIHRVDSHENLGIDNKPKPKYIIVCAQCGQTFERVRASKLTEHPERYRCKCGGTLSRKK